MKRILLPFFLFASAVQAHPEHIVVRHPQANVNYNCEHWQSLNECVSVACSYATTYDCRIIAQNHNVYYIETYASEIYTAPIVVMPPVVYTSLPILWFSFNNQTQDRRIHRHEVRHRPRRR
jgi:hypothetical protein